jgi:hypothetical protein
MSLAFSAASYENFENNDGVNNSENLDRRQQIQQKRSTTQKRRPNIKVENMLSKIHEGFAGDDEEEDNYKPLQPMTGPKSASSERLDALQHEQQKQQKTNSSKEPMVNMTSNNELLFRTLGKSPQPNEDDYDANDYSNYGNEKTNEEYYKRMLPGYQQQQQNLQNGQTNAINKPYYNQVVYKAPENYGGEDSVLLQKMNYMITLLEDQQDERTNNVTEEVILYSFLGIFIIFLSDTFVRAGKYVR